MLASLMSVPALALPSKSSTCRGLPLTEVPLFSQLPKDIQSIFRYEDNGKSDTAERDAPFNETDVMSHDYPMFRFRLAAINSICAIISRERGGWGRGFQVFVLAHESSGWHVASAGERDTPPDSIEELVTQAGFP
jgi:hypothetical protein